MSYLLINDIRFVSKEMLESNCISKFNPEAIIYIEKAGRLIGCTMANHLNIQLFAVSTTRAGDSMKNKIKLLFNYLPWQVSHLIRKMELASPYHKNFGKREVIINKPLPNIKETRILLVDDAIDSGVSIKSVVKFLNERGDHNILTAVITTTSSDPIYQADYSHFNKLLTFPWSIGSKDYNDYQKLYLSLNE